MDESCIGKQVLFVQNHQIGDRLITQTKQGVVKTIENHMIAVMVHSVYGNGPFTSIIGEYLLPKLHWVDTKSPDLKRITVFS